MKIVKEWFLGVCVVAMAFCAFAKENEPVMTMSYAPLPGSSNGQMIECRGTMESGEFLYGTYMKLAGFSPAAKGTYTVNGKGAAVFTITHINQVDMRSIDKDKPLGEAVEGLSVVNWMEVPQKIVKGKIKTSKDKKTLAKSAWVFFQKVMMKIMM